VSDSPLLCCLSRKYSDAPGLPNVYQGIIINQLTSTSLHLFYTCIPPKRFARHHSKLASTISKPSLQQNPFWFNLMFSYTLSHIHPHPHRHLSNNFFFFKCREWQIHRDLRLHSGTDFVCIY
jgi:hypothetical protein